MRKFVSIHNLKDGRFLLFYAKDTERIWIKTTQRQIIVSSLFSQRLDDATGAMVKRLATALRVAGSISTRNKYLHGLQIWFRIWLFV